MLGYGYQDSSMLIGTKSGTILTPVTLTAVLADNRKVFETGGLHKIELCINYTTGAGETDNVLELVLESSVDGTNFYQTLNDAASAGDSVLTQRTWKFTGAAAATAYSLSLPFEVSNNWMRVSIRETGVVTNFGTCSIELTRSGAK